MPSFDAAALLQEYGDEAFVRELAGLLIASVPPQVDAVQQAIAAGDADEVRAGCHRLRGSVAPFGVPTIVERVRSLEDAGARGTLADARALGTSIAADIRVLCEEARGWLERDGAP